MMAATARSSSHPDILAYRKKLKSLAALGSSVQAVSDEADAVLREVRTPVPPPPIVPTRVIVLRQSEALVKFDEEEPTTRQLRPVRT